MKNIAILLSFLLSSCCFTDELHFDVDIRLKQAVDSFFEEAEKHGKLFHKDGLSVRIGKISSSGLTSRSAMCNYVVITINESFFQNNNTPDALALEYIVFHEFGHYMKRKHNNQFSIMNPNTYAAAYHNDPLERQQLIDELFTNQ